MAQTSFFVSFVLSLHTLYFCHQQLVLLLQIAVLVLQDPLNVFIVSDGYLTEAGTFEIVVIGVWLGYLRNS